MMASRLTQTLTTLLLTAGLLVMAGQYAHASYIDPGSGSYLFQVAIAGVLGGIFTLRGMISKWRASHLRRNSKPKSH